MEFPISGSLIPMVTMNILRTALCRQCGVIVKLRRSFCTLGRARPDSNMHFLAARCKKIER